MKKLLSILAAIFCFVSSYGQVAQNLGAPNTEIRIRGFAAIDTGGLQYRTNYADTFALNLSQFLSSRPGMTARTGNTLWIRNATATQWIEFGAGSLNIDTTESVILRGNGSTGSPLTADLQVSTQAGNIIQVFPDGVFAQTQTQVQNGLISGGLVIWQNNLNYIVTPATYAIGGVIYNSPQTTITLPNADPVNPRFDAFIVTSSSTATNITGTPAADPQNPSFDPTTQLPLTFVQVTANMTAPAFCRDSIYYVSNGQTWTGVVSNAGRINTTSTNNPYSVPQDVEFTLAQNGDQYRVTKSTTISFSTYKVLTFQIRSKATWAANSRVNIRAYNGLTPLGINVALGDGIFGFNSSITNAYQLIAIPVGNLGGGLGTADNILFSIQTTGANTIGFYLDDIQLLGCDGTPIPVTGRFWSQGGDTWGTTGVIGTLDNFNVQQIVNNTNHTVLQSGGSTWMQGTTPRLSFFLGTGANSDYYIQRSGTTIIENSAGDYSWKVSGNAMMTLGSANGLLINNSSAAFMAQITNLGNFNLGTNANNATTIFNVSSTTKSSHPAPSMTNAQMTAIATPQTGDFVYNSTNTAPYYYNGVAWVPFGNVTANNGLSTSGVNNVQLGGSALVQNSAVSTSAFSFTMTSSSTAHTIAGINTSSGYGVYGETNTQYGVYGLGNGAFSTGVYGATLGASGAGVIAEATTSGIGLSARSQDGVAGLYTINPSSTNTLAEVLRIQRSSTGTAANGIGSYISFQGKYDASSTDEATRVASKWTNVSNRTSSIEFYAKNANSMARKFAIAGSGALTADGYGVGAITGTPTFTLQVDASGNIIEGAIGAGTGNVLSTGTPVNDQLAVWTNATTVEGDVSLTFASAALTIGLAGTTTGKLKLTGSTSGTITIQGANAAGTYTLTLPTDDGNAGEVLSTNGSGVLSWIAAGAVGTVTNVTWTGGIVSIANPTTVPAFTITGTSGGIPYFSSSSTWASSAALAANAIVIGGGAGVAPSTTTTASGILTFLGSPSSANLRTAVTDETGTGALYFQSGDLGTPTAGTISTGVTLGDVTMNVTGTDATGDIYYRSAGGILTRLALGTSGQVLSNNGTIPTWTTISGTGTVTSVTLAQPAAGITITNSGVPQTTAAAFTFALANDLAAVEGLATTGIVRRTATNTWTAGTLVDLTTEVTGILPTANGGTGFANGFSNGQLLIGNGSGGLSRATITGTANQINITNGSGSITVSMAWNNTEQTLADAATTTWNTTNGGNAVWTNNGTNRTLNITNAIGGYTYTLYIIQGAGGSHTVGTWTNVEWQGGTAPTLSTTAGAIDVISLKYRSATGLFYGTYGLNMQ